MHKLSLSMESATSCPGCRGQRLREAFAPDLWLCQACGRYFRNPRPTESAVVHYYDTSITDDRWQHETDVRRYQWDKRLRILLKYKTTGALLDVGSGDGLFLPFANQYFEICATEGFSTASLGRRLPKNCGSGGARKGNRTAGGSVNDERILFFQY